MCRMTGYSSEIPLAPRIVRAVRQISSASRMLLSLPRLTCSGRSVPASLRRPRCSARSLPLDELECHVGELGLGELEPRDRPAELLALHRVAPGRVERGARRAQGAPHDAVARLVQARQRPFRPRTSGSTASPGRRTPSRTSSLVTEARSDSLCLISGAEKPGCWWGRRSRGCRRAPPRLRPDHGDIGDGAVGDPHLPAVEDPVVAVTPGARPHRARVGAGVGLGQPEAPDRLAGGHARQPFLLLLLASPAPDAVHRQRTLHRDQRAHARVGRLSSRHARP